MTVSFAIRGRFVHALPALGEIEYIEDGLLIVQANGYVLAFAKTTEAADALSVWPCPETIQLGPDEFVCPGFIDTHVHAPQYQYTGTATDLPLMEWLQEYTFPAERRMEDAAFARTVYSKLVRRLLDNGTTTSVYYASIHLEATKVLVDVCRELGQRAIVGKVAMDQHGGEGYVETTADALRDTEALVEYCVKCEPAASSQTRLVNGSVCPRFIPTCSVPLLRGLGEIAEKHRCWVQSHIAESPDEMAFVDALHPGRRDAEIFDAHKLLTSRTVMAHGVHLRPDEVELLVTRGSGVACCPLSNFFFAGGELPLKQVQAAGLRVGLGTDVAGGYSPSMLSSCRTATLASKVVARAAGGGADADVDYRRAFWTATMGGARAIGLEEHLGCLEVGRQFDAILVDMSCGAFDRFAEAVRTPTRLPVDLEQFINLGDDRNVRRVWVRGRECVRKDSHE